MNVDMSISEEGLDLIERLLQAELDSCYPELRRTRNPDYRKKVMHRQELTTELLDTIHSIQASMHEPAGAGT